MNPLSPDACVQWLAVFSFLMLLGMETSTNLVIDLTAANPVTVTWSLLFNLFADYCNKSTNASFLELARQEDFRIIGNVPSAHLKLVFKPYIPVTAIPRNMYLFLFIQNTCPYTEKHSAVANNQNRSRTLLKCFCGSLWRLSKLTRTACLVIGLHRSGVYCCRC